MARGIQDARYRQLIAKLAGSRRKAGMSQADLAHKLGKRQQFVSKYESGERRLDAIEVIDICRALSLDSVRLLHESAYGDGESLS